MKLKHKEPCVRCPFRRKSWPGYLGADEPDHFLLLALSDGDMPCHTKVNYEDPAWEAKLKNKPMCAGRLVFLKNQIKLPRDRELANAVNAIERDTEAVFEWPHEFLAHHKPDTKKRGG